MKIASWEDYKIIKASNGLKLEKWNNIKLLRPDPIIIWNDEKINKVECDAFYHRSNTGGGYWENINSVPSQWKVSYKTLTSLLLFFIVSIILSQLTACSGNKPVCLKPICLILKVKFL